MRLLPAQENFKRERDRRKSEFLTKNWTIWVSLAQIISKKGIILENCKGKANQKGPGKTIAHYGCNWAHGWPEQQMPCAVSSDICDVANAGFKGGLSSSKLKLLERMSTYHNLVYEVMLKTPKKTFPHSSKDDYVGLMIVSRFSFMPYKRL